MTWEPISAAESVGRQQWLEGTMIARVLCVIVDALGVEADEPEAIRWVRARASAPDGQAQIAEIRQQIADRRLAAMRTSKLPYRDGRFGDGSQVPRAPMDKTDQVMERNRLLAGGQAARHAAMGGNKFIDSSDAHRDQRPIREEIYENERKKAAG
jgi:hypothetical protein